MPASNGRRFALEISADLNRLATDRKHSQAKANAQSDDDDLAAQPLPEGTMTFSFSMLSMH